MYVTATLIDGQWRRSVTNIGTKPTFGENNESSVETFVMNWSGDLYGDVVRVRFLHRLRAEKKFNSLGELKSQIKSDVARAGRLLNCGRQFSGRDILISAAGQFRDSVPIHFVQIQANRHPAF